MAARNLHAPEHPDGVDGLRVFAEKRKPVFPVATGEA